MQALEHAGAAFALAEAVDDDALRERARAMQAILGWIVGDPNARQGAVEAHEFAAAVGGEQLMQEATFAVVSTLAASLPRAEARMVLEREHDEWRERGIFPVIPESALRATLGILARTVTAST